MGFRAQGLKVQRVPSGLHATSISCSAFECCYYQLRILWPNQLDCAVTLSAYSYSYIGLGHEQVARLKKKQFDRPNLPGYNDSSTLFTVMKVIRHSLVINVTYVYA